MLWACLHFPRLPLEALVRAGADTRPLAVAEGATRPRVIALNGAARRAGVRAGMAIAGALALAPGLELRARAPAQEARTLREIAQWALQFSPALSIEGEEALLLEVGAGLKLFGGIEALLGTIRREVGDLGFSTTLAAAPTATAALMLARAGSSAVVAEPADLHAQLATLPVECLGCGEEVVQTLADLGVTTLGALLGLPREGVARRFGTALLEMLDRASGARPDPRLPYEPPQEFEARIELPAPAWEIEGIAFALRRLVSTLVGWLRGRGRGAMRLRLDLVHERCPASALAVNLSAPSRDADHLQRLLRERLERVELPDRIEAIALTTEASSRLDAQDRSLFDTANPADAAQLLERLCARLGDAAVLGVRPCADHRPELAWRVGTPGAAAAQQSAPGPRPLWLLPQPQPLIEFLRGAAAPPVLMDGPERIESGWWEDGDVCRDYFVARTGSGQTLWIFTVPGHDEWQVHGIFA